MKKKMVIIASLAESLINFRLHLIKEFLKRDFEVIAMAPADPDTAAKLATYSVRFVALPMERNGQNPLKDLQLLKYLYLFLRREQPSIVFSYTIKPVIYGSIAAQLTQVPQIYAMLTGTGYIFSNTNWKNKVIGFIAKTLFKSSLRFNKKLFFQNPDNIVTFLQNKLISKNHPVVLINGSGVDITHFEVAPFPHKITFLMIARLLIDKGVREYAEAAAKIKQKYPDIDCQLVGWIDTNPQAINQRELSKWIDSGAITYLGKLSDVRPAIKNCSVYVLPSYGEGTPRTVLEAMAMARPIITTDVPGCRETVIHQHNGLLIPPADAESLYHAMEYFIINDEQIAKMGSLSRAMAESKYDVNKVNAVILDAMAIT